MPTHLDTNKGLFGFKKLVVKPKVVKNIHPRTPARTRFAPSPTGFLHIGSLRTALYNYLLAKNTGGQFLLRLEDTDRNRLVKGAEQNIYETLRWAGLNFDEGPGVNERYGPYRQSDRTSIYAKYSDDLLNSGHAYRCFCARERLDALRKSAMELQPPTTASYDGHCAKLSKDEISQLIAKKVPYTIRFKAPLKYEPVHDLLHGELDMQPQINPNYIRYDDPILLKSDGFPTYHFANVVDDHLMHITHVIRGEEWLPSTPKHVALYKAFGWNPPAFVHIPLLTTKTDKKISKRNGDTNISSLRDSGILPEALVNFCALFGWSAPRELSATKHDCFTLTELIKLFDLNHLTKGNAKVDDSKLTFFNKHYLNLKLEDERYLSSTVENLCENLSRKYPDLTASKIEVILYAVKPYLSRLSDLESNFSYLFTKPCFEDNKHVNEFKEKYKVYNISRILLLFEETITEDNIETLIEEAVKAERVPKRVVFESLRFALSGSIPGLKIPLLVSILGADEARSRIAEARCMHL